MEIKTPMVQTDAVIICKCADKKHSPGAWIRRELDRWTWMPTVLIRIVCDYTNPSWTELCNSNTSIWSDTPPAVEKTEYGLLRVFKAMEQIQPHCAFRWTNYPVNDDRRKTEYSFNLLGAASFSRASIHCDSVENFIQQYSTSSSWCKSTSIAVAFSEPPLQILPTSHANIGNAPVEVPEIIYNVKPPWACLCWLVCCPVVFCWWCNVETVPQQFTLTLQARYLQAHGTTYQLVDVDGTDADGITTHTTEWQVVI